MDDGKLYQHPNIDGLLKTYNDLMARVEAPLESLRRTVQALRALGYDGPLRSTPKELSHPVEPQSAVIIILRRAGGALDMDALVQELVSGGVNAHRAKQAIAAMLNNGKFLKKNRNEVRLVDVED